MVNFNNVKYCEYKSARTYRLNNQKKAKSKVEAKRASELTLNSITDALSKAEEITLIGFVFLNSRVFRTYENKSKDWVQK